MLTYVFEFEPLGNVTNPAMEDNAPTYRLSVEVAGEVHSRSTERKATRHPLVTKAILEGLAVVNVRRPVCKCGRTKKGANGACGSCGGLLRRPSKRERKAFRAADLDAIFERASAL